MFAQSFVRLRASTVTDRYGDKVPDWSEPDRTTITGVNIQPLSQSEDSSPLRDAKVTAWRISSMPGIDIDLLATDRAEVDGALCTVEGEVARWPHPLIPGAVHHVEATVERVAG